MNTKYLNRGIYANTISLTHTLFTSTKTIENTTHGQRTIRIADTQFPNSHKTISYSINEIVRIENDERQYALRNLFLPEFHIRNIIAFQFKLCLICQTNQQIFELNT